MSEQATLDPAPEQSPRPRGWLRGWRTPRRLRVAGLVTGALLAVAAGLVLWSPLFSGGGQDVAETSVPVAWARPVVSADGLADRSGVRITQVAVTGGGGLVDLRFQVVDPDKAAALHDAATPPAVVDEQSGLVVHELFMGHAHSDPFKAGVTYYYVFNDPVNWVHRGGQVTVLLGNAQVEHVVVR